MSKLDSHNIYAAEMDAVEVSVYVQALARNYQETAIRLNEAERLMRGLLNGAVGSREIEAFLDEMEG